MIECIFTLDYEVYDNGAGSLRDLVYGSASQFAELFQRRDARSSFVVQQLPSTHELGSERHRILSSVAHCIKVGC
jgi:hypothetical protein